MVSKPQLYNLFRHSIRSKNTKVITNNRILTNQTTTSQQPTESPNLPEWFKKTSDNTNEDNDDDFVIPSLAGWLESPSRVDRTNVGKHRVFDNTETTDLDKLCGILKQRFGSVDSVVNELNGCCVSLSSSLLEQVFKRFSNDWVPAFGVFVWAKGQMGWRYSPELCDMMVDILGKAKKFDRMWDVLNEMEKMGEGYVTTGTMSKVIRRLARAGKYWEAVDAFKGIGRYGLSSDTSALNVLLDALVKEGGVECAHEVFSEFKDGVPLSSQTFNVLIHGFCKIRKPDDARKVMDDMESHGFKPDVVSYTSFVEAYCREKDFRKVDAILDEMQQKGCKPNAVTYTIIMHSYGKGKQINEALEVYEKMKQNGCVPDASFYSSLIYILGKAGRIKDANALFEDMKKEGVMPDVVTYNTLIASACEHSQEETALKLLKKMEEDSCKPDIKTYAPLLKMCCKKKWIKVLYFLLDHMFKNDLSIELGTYSLLVHGLCKSGKLELASSFFEEMVSKGMRPKDTTYKLLVEHLEAKSMTKAKEKIAKLMQEAKGQESV